MIGLGLQYRLFHSAADGGDIRVVIRQIVSHDEEEPLLLEHEALEK